jgi:ketosteroid isomerase-like protein
MAKDEAVTTLETNRATVLQFCECLSRRDFVGMMELVTSDATWWVVGRPDYAPYAGLHTITEVVQILQDFVGPYDTFEFTVESTTAEGDRVAIEAQSSGRMGAVTYKNTYSKHFKICDGKIASVREFFDAYEITAYLDQLGVSSAEAFAGLGGPA